MQSVDLEDLNSKVVELLEGALKKLENIYTETATAARYAEIVICAVALSECIQRPRPSDLSPSDILTKMTELYYHGVIWSNGELRIGGSDEPIQ